MKKASGEFSEFDGPPNTASDVSGLAGAQGSPVVIATSAVEEIEKQTKLLQSKVPALGPMLQDFVNMLRTAVPTALVDLQSGGMGSPDSGAPMNAPMGPPPGAGGGMPMPGGAPMGPGGGAGMPPMPPPPGL